MSSNPNQCDVCGVDVSTLPECPAIFQLASYRVGGPGYFDPELVPKWGARMLQRPTGRLRMCYRCVTPRVSYRGKLDEIHQPEKL